MRTPAG
jgi:hypothetical protein